MPKKPKTTTENEPSPAVGAETNAPTPETAKPVAKKRAAKTPAASRKAAAKKKPGMKVVKPKPAATAKPAAANEPSDADIRLRAYFIAERRAKLSLHGDPALDWIEARQQLLQEARKAQS